MIFHTPVMAPEIVASLQLVVRSHWISRAFPKYFIFLFKIMPIYNFQGGWRFTYPNADDLNRAFYISISFNRPWNHFVEQSFPTLNIWSCIYSPIYA